DGWGGRRGGLRRGGAARAEGEDGREERRGGARGPRRRPVGPVHGHAPASCARRMVRGRPGVAGPRDHSPGQRWVFKRKLAPPPSRSGNRGRARPQGPPVATPPGPPTPPPAPSPPPPRPPRIRRGAPAPPCARP